MAFLTAAVMHGMFHMHTATDCGIECRAAGSAGGEVDYIICSTHRLKDGGGTVAVSSTGGVEDFSVRKTTSATEREEMEEMVKLFSSV